MAFLLFGCGFLDAKVVYDVKTAALGVAIAIELLLVETGFLLVVFGRDAVEENAGGFFEAVGFGLVFEDGF